MRCGISTACFYPMPPLEALTYLAEAGVPATELFINTFSEMEDAYVARLVEVIDATGIKVGSLHPFTGVMEGLLFASRYRPRFEDGIALYRKYFETCRRVGADVLVFHGDHHYNTQAFPDAEYAKAFRELAAVGAEYGVTMCQENVAYCRLRLPENARALTPLLGDAAAYVLDTKQARRRDCPVEDMLDAMAGHIRKVHVSDYTAERNCLVPGRGEMDIPGLIGQLRAAGYDGDLIIEVYEDNYESPQELLDAMRLIESYI